MCFTGIELYVSMHLLRLIAVDVLAGFLDIVASR